MLLRSLWGISFLMCAWFANTARDWRHLGYNGSL
jgi:hypothetical protein